MTLWGKGEQTHPEVIAFTTGKDRHFDNRLIRHDITGTLAHIQMLHAVGLLSADELKSLQTQLKEMYLKAMEGNLEVPLHCEDVHSFIEEALTRKLGDVGKKVHTGRSRNDQVLLDIRLFLRDEINAIAQKTHELFALLLKLGKKHEANLMPGYTHMQVAMPSSFGLWFASFAESLTDDLRLLKAAYDMVNRNPLGSGAGYGSSLPLDRKLTTRLLKMDGMNVNAVYAQRSRVKVERTVASALASLASTLSVLSNDVCLYSGQNFRFFSFPDHLTTGSSIMPHKRNPDVWELIRGHCNKIQSLPNEIALTTSNLPTGYHRDFQIVKESLFPALDTLSECLTMAAFMLTHIVINEKVLEDEVYASIYSVEKVNKMVLEGVPFREAYRRVASEIKEGTIPGRFDLNHTHAGSMGNLSLDLIEKEMMAVWPQHKIDGPDLNSMNEKSI